MFDLSRVTLFMAVGLSVAACDESTVHYHQNGSPPGALQSAEDPLPPEDEAFDGDDELVDEFASLADDPALVDAHVLVELEGGPAVVGAFADGVMRVESASPLEGIAADWTGGPTTLRARVVIDGTPGAWADLAVVFEEEGVYFAESAFEVPATTFELEVDAIEQVTYLFVEPIDVVDESSDTEEL